MAEADSGAPVYSDGYVIFLAAGTTVTITMTSSALDSYLELLRFDGVVVAQNDNADAGTKDARITFTVSQDELLRDLHQVSPGNGGRGVHAEHSIEIGAPSAPLFGRAGLSRHGASRNGDDCSRA